MRTRDIEHKGEQDDLQEIMADIPFVHYKGIDSKNRVYIRKQHVYGAIGDNCTIQKRKVPLYANLIRLENNVHIASNVSFQTHDVSYMVLNNLPEILKWGGDRNALAA